MARLVGTVNRYIGTSGEEKPYVGQVQPDGSSITAADLPGGSTFEEGDTGDEYRFDGRGWNLIGRAADQTSRIVNKLQEILDELRVQTGHLAAGSDLESKQALELASL